MTCGMAQLIYFIRLANETDILSRHIKRRGSAKHPRERSIQQICLPRRPRTAKFQSLITTRMHSLAPFLLFGSAIAAALPQPAVTTISPFCAVVTKVVTLAKAQSTEDQSSIERTELRGGTWNGA